LTQSANEKTAVSLFHRKAKASCLAELRALGPDAENPAIEAVRARYPAYIWWQVQQLLSSEDSEPAPEYIRSKEALRSRVTNRLLWEAETAEEAKDRIQALGKLLVSCDARDAKTKADPLTEQTEDAVRAELRDPQPRLVELMIEEWCDTSSQDTEGNPTRPAIEELVRRLATRFEDVLEADGWVRR
jgi:hypothetical protein